MKSVQAGFTRRDWLVLPGLAASAVPAPGAQAAPQAMTAVKAPVAPVSVAKIRSYDEDLAAHLEKMFDQIGGLGSRVRGKTVAMKLNLTGSARFEGLTAGETHWVHPQVVGALTAVLGKAGARRVRILEGAGSREPNFRLEDKLFQDRWDIQAIRNAAPAVEFEDTDHAGSGKRYTTLKVRTRPYVFPSFDVNRAYQDCDFLISVGKAKNHEEMGVTMTIKNMFGITPLAVYESRERLFHFGQVQAPSGVAAELDPQSDRYEGWRLPRILVDIVGARPIDLAINDLIVTTVGGEGPWVRGSRPIKPGLLVAGWNCVNTDAVTVAAMGYNPRAGRHEAPYRVFKSRPRTKDQAIPAGERFDYADNVMLLSEAVGIGSADLARIDVRGVPIKDAMFDFEAFWKNQMPKEA